LNKNRLSDRAKIKTVPMGLLGCGTNEIRKTELQYSITPVSNHFKKLFFNKGNNKKSDD